MFRSRIAAFGSVLTRITGALVHIKIACPTGGHAALGSKLLDEVVRADTVGIALSASARKRVWLYRLIRVSGASGVSAPSSIVTWTGNTFVDVDVTVASDGFSTVMLVQIH